MKKFKGFWAIVLAVGLLLSLSGAGLAADGAPGVTVTETDGTTAIVEGGAGDTYTVVLDTQPAADVTVTATSDGLVTVNGQPSVVLTFTVDTWNVPQTVTVAAPLNGLVEGERTSVISHTVASADANYSGIAAASVTVTIAEGDTLPPGVTITESDGFTRVPDEDTTDSYTMVLTSAPTGDVTIVATPDPTAEKLLWVNGGPTATLVFTVDNWSVPQEVVVSLADEDEGDDEGDDDVDASTVRTSAILPACDDEGDDDDEAGDDDGANCNTVTITHVATGGGYDGVVIPDVLVCTGKADLDLHAPRNLKGATAPDGVTLTWKAPENVDRLPSTVAAQGYEVYVAGRASGPYVKVKDVTELDDPSRPSAAVTTTDCSAVGFTLAGGQKYAFRLTYFVVFDTGERLVSKYSNVANVTAGPLPAAAPTGLKAYPTDLGVGLTWKAPGDSHGHGRGHGHDAETAVPVPAGYSIWISASSRSDFLLVKEVESWTGESPNAEVTAADMPDGVSLVPGQKYYFRVFSFIDDAATGAHVLSTKAATACAAAGPVGSEPPMSLKAKGSDTGISLTWKAPKAKKGGPAPEGYVVFIAADKHDTPVELAEVTDLAYQITVETCAAVGFTLTPGEKYQVWVYSYRTVGGVRILSAKAAHAEAKCGPEQKRGHR